MSPAEGPTRKDRILAAAQAEFAAHGFAGARVERIAAEARVNKQLLFHYFASKDGLYRAAAAAASSQLELEPKRSGTPTERLRDLVLRLLVASGHWGAILDASVRASAVRGTARVIRDGQAQGHFRDDVDPDTVAEVVVAASFGAWNPQTEEPPTATRAAPFADTLARMVADHCSWH